ncbi:hypothetical protein M0802_008867 [Mischocyttarus mexicanus]|nr:hypothetical protein M0802_008867 [Mischocyttarus mexicanus]
MSPQAVIWVRRQQPLRATTPNLINRNAGWSALRVSLWVWYSNSSNSSNIGHIATNMPLPFTTRSPNGSTNHRHNQPPISFLETRIQKRHQTGSTHLERSWLRTRSKE